MDRTADRYTSSDLSRLLAETGVDQKRQSFGVFVWCGYESPRERLTMGGWGPDNPTAAVRALDLTDVLEELTRDREGGPLCVTWDLQPASDLHGSSAYLCGAITRGGGIPASVWGDTPAGAAGGMLLALLRERGGK